MNKEDVEKVVDFCMTRLESYSLEKKDPNSVKVKPEDNYWMSLVEDNERELFPTTAHYRNDKREAWKTIAVREFCD